MTNLIIISLFAIPLASIVPMLGTNFWYPQWIAFFSLVLIGLAVHLWKWNRIISLFLVYLVLNTVFVGQVNIKSLFALYQIVSGILAVYAISCVTKENRKRIVNAVIWLCVIQAVWVIVQYANLDPIFSYVHDQSRDDTVGFSGSHNQLGIFFSNTFPLVVSSVPLFIPLSIFCLICSTTSSAIIGAGAGLLFYLFMAKRKLFIYAVALFTICGFLYITKYDMVSMTEFNMRKDLCKLTFSQVAKGHADLKIWNKNTKEYEYKTVRCNPLFGYGLSTFINISPYTQYVFMGKHADEPNGHRYEHAHNDWVEIVFEGGYIALLFIVLWVIDLGNKLRLYKNKQMIIYASCIVAHFVTACGIYTVHTAVSGMMLIVMLGLFYGEVRDEKRKAVVV
jgi:O-antigen ligase